MTRTNKKAAKTDKTLCFVCDVEFRGSVVLHSAVVNAMAACVAKDTAEVERLLADVDGLTKFRFGRNALRDWIVRATAPVPAFFTATIG